MLGMLTTALPRYATFSAQWRAAQLAPILGERVEVIQAPDPAVAQRYGAMGERRFPWAWVALGVGAVGVGVVLWKRVRR